MKKLDYFNQTFEDFLNSIVNKWKSKGFKYHNGHLKLLKFAYLVKVRWAVVFKKKMQATKDFLKQFNKFADKLLSKQLTLF